MPQMKPLNWFILFLFMNMMLTFMNMMIYFLKSNKMNNYKKKIFLNYKWKW